jgi:hypothetical protein
VLTSPGLISRVVWDTLTTNSSGFFASNALTKLVLPAPEGAEIVNKQAVFIPGLLEQSIDRQNYRLILVIL